MKKKHLLIGIIILVFIFLAVFKNEVVKITVTTAARVNLGADVRINGLSFGIFRPRVIIRGLKVYNPKGFPREELINLPMVSVEYDLPALIRKNIHLKKVEVDLKHMVLFKNKEGKLNVDELNVAKEQKNEAAAKPQAAPQFKIDYLTLSIGQVIVKDFSQSPPVIEAYDINIKNKAYKDLTSPQQAASLIMVEAMKPTAIKSAGLYAASSVAGMAFLPFTAAVLATTGDSASAEYNHGFDKVYRTCLNEFKQFGKLTKEDKVNGLLEGQASGCDISVKIQKSGSKTKVTVTARKYFLPKREAAAGMLYLFTDKLK